MYRKKSYKFRKRYLLLLSTSISSAILWERQVICLPVATVAAPALGTVVAAAGVAAVVAVTGDLVLAAKAVAAATARDLVPLRFFLAEKAAAATGSSSSGSRRSSRGYIDSRLHGNSSLS
jgi:hypothetical protein